MSKKGGRGGEVALWGRGEGDRGAEGVGRIIERMGRRCWPGRRGWGVEEGWEG